jgi:hypothetical protein
MTRLSDNRAILGIDPGPRGVSFVFFENGELVDWGTCGKSRDELEVFDRLLKRLRPDVLVLEDTDARQSERRARMRHVLRMMAERAEEARVSVRTASRHTVRRAWRELGMKNKHEVGAALAAMFPEMEVLVPRKRKAWTSEDARAGICDALAVLVHVCASV